MTYQSSRLNKPQQTQVLIEMLRPGVYWLKSSPEIRVQNRQSFKTDISQKGTLVRFSVQLDEALEWPTFSSECVL